MLGRAGWYTELEINQTAGSESVTQDLGGGDVGAQKDDGTKDQANILDNTWASKILSEAIIHANEDDTNAWRDSMLYFG